VAYHGDEDVFVDGVLEGVVLDYGLALGVCRVERDGAARKGFLQRGCCTTAAVEGEFGDGCVVGKKLGGEDGALSQEPLEQAAVGVDAGEIGLGVLEEQFRHNGGVLGGDLRQR